MVAVLNRKSVTGDDLDEASYVAMAGMAEDGILEKIETALAEKFQGQASPELLPASGSLPAGPIAYSYLFKSLPFEWAFERLKDPLRFRGAELESFGIWQYLDDQENEVKAASQMLVYDYAGEGNFIVELKTRSKEDRLILAKVPAEKTLGATAAAVQEHVARNVPTTLDICMGFVVPVVDFDIMREYSELYGKAIRSGNPRFNGLPIVAAKQQVRFKLDETGAVLKSEAFTAAGLGYDLIFDKPFLIMIQRKAAEKPYFALWVENAEILVPYDETKLRSAGNAAKHEEKTRYEPMIEAARIGDLGYIKKLLAEGADIKVVDQFGRNSLWHAAYGGHEEIAKLLLDSGVDPNSADQSGGTPLHEAAEQGHQNLVRMLLNRGADSSAKDDLGYTAMHRAARNGHSDVVKVLLDSGVVPNILDGRGATPLYAAALHGQENVARILLASGADATVKDHRGRTSLHWAAGGNHLKIVEMLLDSGADVNAKEEHDETPLYYAAKHYDHNVVEVAKLLLGRGADPNISNKSRYTALDKALSEGKVALIELLKAHGAKALHTGVMIPFELLQADGTKRLDAEIMTAHIDDIRILKVSKIHFAAPSGVTLYEGFGGEICELCLEMEFPQEVESVTMGPMRSAITDGGRTIVPEQQSPPLPKISSAPDRGLDGRTWYITITLCAPKTEEKSLKEISGELEYVTATKWKTFDAGIIEFTPGAKAQNGKVTVHSIEAVKGGDTLVDLVVDSPASVIRSMRFYGMSGSKLDVDMICPPEQHPTDPKSITAYCFSDPLPNKGRLELDIFEDAESHKILFKANDIPLEYARKSSD